MAVRTNRARDIEGELHFGQRLLEIAGRDGSNYGAAFVANDLGLLSARYPFEATAALRVAEIRMRYGRADDVIVHGAFLS
jgi:hypothetical protein